MKPLSMATDCSTDSYDNTLITTGDKASGAMVQCVCVCAYMCACVLMVSAYMCMRVQCVSVCVCACAYEDVCVHRCVW